MIDFIIAGFALLMGASGCAYVSYLTHLSLQSRYWPYTIGRVIDSRVDYESDEDVYRATIVYSYAISGIEYQGSNLTFLPSASNIRYFAKRIVRQYPIHASVKVYYDIHNPSRCVLLNGFTPLRLIGYLLFFLVCLAFFLGGCIAIYQLLIDIV